MNKRAKCIKEMGKVVENEYMLLYAFTFYRGLLF